MITYVDGNIFESPADVLVNTVNTQGVMGKGIALEFRRLFPKMFEDYRALCERGEIDIGALWMYRTEHKAVLCFPTKKQWRLPSRIEYVEAGLRTLLQTYESANIHSIALPALGCGNGGLDFDSQVKPLMEKYLSRMQARVLVYPHRHAALIPEHRDREEMSAWLRTRPEELAFSEVWEDIVALLNRKQEFHTFGTKTPFTAELSTDPLGIRIRKDGASLAVVLHEHVLDLWQGLRQLGVLRLQEVPSNLARHASYLGPVLAQLPYVRPARVSRDFANAEDFERFAEYALHLLPRTAHPAGQQLELAASS